MPIESQYDSSRRVIQNTLPPSLSGNSFTVGIPDSVQCSSVYSDCSFVLTLSIDFFFPCVVALFY